MMGTYRAAIHYSNGTQSSWTEVFSWGNMLSTDNLVNQPIPMLSETHEAFEIAAIVGAFIQPFDTSLTLPNLSDVPSLPPLFACSYFAKHPLAMTNSLCSPMC
jgi:hypothetical protein